MAILRSKEIAKMTEKEMQGKLKELRFELTKANVAANKSGKIKINEIRKTIAKILTFMAKAKAEQPSKQ